MPTFRYLLRREIPCTCSMNGLRWRMVQVAHQSPTRKCKPYWTVWLPRLLMPHATTSFGRRNAGFAVIKMHARFITELGNRGTTGWATKNSSHRAIITIELLQWVLVPKKTKFKCGYPSKLRRKDAAIEPRIKMAGPMTGLRYSTFPAQFFALTNGFASEQDLLCVHV